MRIVHRYISTDFLFTFVVTLVVFTFVMSIGVVFRVTDLLSRGISWRPVVELLLYAVPPSLAFSIPISALTTTLLLFGRLSADGEITALRACGISLWQVLRSPLLVSLLLAVTCMYINTDLAPRCMSAKRLMANTLGVESPVDLLQENRFIEDFPGLTVYIGKKKKDRLLDIRIYDSREEGFTRQIRAERGIVRVAEDRRTLLIQLFNVKISPFSREQRTPLFCEEWTIPIQDTEPRRQHRKRFEEMLLPELTAALSDMEAAFPSLSPEDRVRERMALAVELNKRLSLAAACIAFVLLGMPLGIKAHRRESSMGVAMSLFLVFNFYLFIIVAESLSRNPVVRPDFIVWLPVLISVSLGAILIERSA